MLIDFDHGVVEVDRPIRLQGIYKRDVRVGHNVWIGLRRVRPARRAPSATTRSSGRTPSSPRTSRRTPSPAAAGAVVRMRDAPESLRWAPRGHDPPPARRAGDAADDLPVGRGARALRRLAAAHARGARDGVRDGRRGRLEVTQSGPVVDGSRRRGVSACGCHRGTLNPAPSCGLAQSPMQSGWRGGTVVAMPHALSEELTGQVLVAGDDGLGRHPPKRSTSLSTSAPPRSSSPRTRRRRRRSSASPASSACASRRRAPATTPAPLADLENTILVDVPRLAASRSTRRPPGARRRRRHWQT